MELSRRAALKTLGAAAIGAVTGFGTYGFAIERHRLVVTRATVPVSGLAPALDGLRIALVTDVHHGRMVPAEDVQAAVRMTLDARPDLIVLGGDFVTWGERRYVQPVAELLSPLHAPFGVFAVLGNHDDDRDMPSALMRRGFAVLKDARTHVTIRGEGLDIVGIRYWTRRVQEIAKLLRGSRNTAILLAHDPRRLTEAAALDVPLLLSGHTHGGQIVLPGVGPIVARKFPVLWGTARQDNTAMFVSRGVGTVYVPLRINCPPEVAILTLRRQSAI